MKILFELLPVALFFVVYKIYGFYPAIYAMLAAAAVQIFVARLRDKKWPKMQLIAFLFLIVLGGVSLVFRDPAFVMWKVSALYLAFAIILLASDFWFERPILEKMLGKEIRLPRKIWRRATWFWSGGFVGIALLNAYFVRIAEKSRAAFFDQSALSPKIELSNLDCAQMEIPLLCRAALHDEAAWVDFKLFGTLGISFLMIVIFVFLIRKHLQKPNEKNPASS